MRLGMTFGIVAGLVCSAAFAASAHAASLTTDFTGNNTATAIAFDVHVLPESGVFVSSMDVNVDSPAGTPEKVSVWRRTGTYEGFLGSQDGWTLAGAVNVLSAGPGQPTKVAVDFTLAQGVHGFLVHLEPDPPNVHVLRTENGVGPGATVFQNGSLRVVTGTRVVTPFTPGGEIFPRDFNGTFHYDFTVAAPTIDAGPTGKTGSSTGSFAFSAPTGQALSFQCRLFPSIDPAPPFAPCSGPGATHSFSLPAGGTYTFEVRSIDADGAVSDPVSRAFAFEASSEPTDTDPPETKITKAPANSSTKHKVKYVFSSDEPGSTFECKLDRKPFKPCASPKKFKVDDGRHAFKVRAVDVAGNADSTPARDKFKVLG